MNIQEIRRRLEIINEKKVPIITKQMLRGGMQERLRRQDIRRYKNAIRNHKNNLNMKLDLLEAQKDSDFAVMSFSNNFNKPFNKPKLKRIKNKRSFF